jgi:hypothetical protein
VVDLGDRVVLSAAGAEPVRERLEISLEDGFEHQLQGCLDHAILHGWDGDFILPILAVASWDHALLVDAAFLAR